MIKITKKNYFKIIVFFLIWPFFVSGASNDVVINEIAWMGTDISANDEWVELYNNTDQEIDLAGWMLKALDNSPEISLEGKVTSNGYFLLERTDDNSVLEITADQIYTGALSNSGENLELRDTENNLIDSVDCLDGWLAGDNITKQTMERIDSHWQTSLDINGTPKAQNSSGQESPLEEPSEEPDENGWIPPTVVNHPPMAQAGPGITALVNQEIAFDASQSLDPDNDTLSFFWNFGDGTTETQEKPSHAYLYPGQYMVTLMVDDEKFFDLDIITINIYSQAVIISEFIPNQWIELYNQTDQVANLTNWQLSDFTFPANSLIAPKQFLVLGLNNNTDQVRLFYPDGSLAREISYLDENKDDSAIAFDGLDYFWTKTPTPGIANIISNISHNQPTPITQQAQQPPKILAANLNSSQEFPVLTPAQEQTASLAPSIKTTQPTQLNQSTPKSTLILTLSIIISGSLLVSWFLIRIRRRQRLSM